MKAVVYHTYGSPEVLKCEEVQTHTKGGPRYDLIPDCVGKHPFPANGRALRRGGTYVVVAGPSGRWMK